ncbi:MAG: hypothetical protein PHS53_00950 [Candidatus Pacebacteria bacterium]|nr:hypothetical protein [Candidatus Paceibacterota bacterium]MDD5356705.1 hypothetical protein [Candidatus Paceibacterota bacterium]
MKKSLIIASVWALPGLAFAAGFDNIIGLAQRTLSQLVPLFISAAVVLFLYGVLTYILAGGDEEKRSAGRNTMIYGIIAIFVMVSVWGLVNLLRDSLQLNQANNVPNLLPATHN